MVAVGVVGASVNEGEHGQVLGLEFAGRIDQHAFDGGAVVGLPLVGLALRKIALGEELVEGSDGAGRSHCVWPVCQVDLGGRGQRGILECDTLRVRSGGEFLVSSFLPDDRMQRIGGIGGGVHLNFGAEARGDDDSVGGRLIADDLAGKVFGPLLNFLAEDVHPIQMRLQVAVGAGDISLFNTEEDVAAVVGPAWADFGGLILGDADGIGTIGIGLAVGIERPAGDHQSEGIDFDVFGFFLALVDRIGNEREGHAVGRSQQMIDA